MHIPEAVPQYVQKFGPITSKEAVDVAFSLIQLATGALQFHSLADLGQLLLPEARTPEPLNVLESWLLLQVLKAVEALPSTPASIQQVPPHNIPAPALACAIQTKQDFPLW